MQTSANMTTREIPREEWIGFLNDFSKKHEGWIVVLEVLGPDIGDQEETDDLPLVGISADVKDGENRILITTGGRPETHLTRIINGPKRVWYKTPQIVADEAIEIEGEDGTTLLTFRHIPVEATERQLPEKT